MTTFIIVWAISLVTLISVILVFAALGRGNIERMELEIQAELAALEEEERKAA